MGTRLVWETIKGCSLMQNQSPLRSLKLSSVTYITQFGATAFMFCCICKVFGFPVFGSLLYFFSARHDADNLNKMKNLASKIIGEKMKVKKNYMLLNFQVVYRSDFLFNFQVVYRSGFFNPMLRLRRWDVTSLCMQ